LRKLRLPTLEIVSDSLVGVKAINVEQVHSTVGELSKSLIEGCPE
jgi:hypothetical protein